MAVRQPVERGQLARADPHLAYWADGADAPIRLAPFECCRRYVCRCDEGEG